MSEKNCTLCDLPVPDNPVTDKNTEGIFCCSGCLNVHQLLQELDEEEARQLREQTIDQRKRERAGTELPEQYSEAFFKVEGMHCSTCESFIEAIAGRQQGIYKSEASYASEMVKIYYDPERLDANELPPLLSKMGYSVRETDAQPGDEDLNEAARLLIGAFFGIIGLIIYALFLYPTYVSGEGFIPMTDSELLFFISNVFVMTSFVLFYTGFPILRGAWVSLRVLKPNMDLLVTIAALSAYLYSFGALLSGTFEVYFDVTVAIVLVVSVGNYYENKIKSRKRDLLAQLSDKKITHARLQQNGEMKKVSLSDVQAGDRIVVKAGERIPVDGTVIKGQGIVNEALMTGESMPVTKQDGDRVLSGTTLTQNALTLVTDETVQSTIDELLRLMWNIQSSRPGRQRLADRIASWFVPGVIVLGMGTFLFYIISGGPVPEALLSALAVLIVSCPCALGLATPLAIASGTREAMEHEIIFRTAEVFEKNINSDIVAFDKTGTLTSGQMQLLDDGNNPEALEYASLLEEYSSHPVATPIAAVEADNNLEVEHFQSYTTGVSGKIGGKTVWAGKPEWLAEKQFNISSEFHTSTEEARNQGNVPVAVAWDGRIQSILVVGDQLRDEAEIVVTDLRDQDKEIAIITGDSDRAAQHVTQKLVPDFLFTEARPESKSNIIDELRSLGTVAMVGDGSNDAPALANADLGIAFGDLTAIAADSAHVVIPGNKLSKIPAAFRAIRQTKKRIQQNLGWAFLYNIITIPLAVAGLINPLFAAIAMAASSLLVVTNSSRKMQLER